MAVNAAGIGGPSQTPIADIEEADGDAVLETNLKAVWRCMKFEIRVNMVCPGLFHSEMVGPYLEVAPAFINPLTTRP